MLSFEKARTTDKDRITLIQSCNEAEIQAAEVRQSLCRELREAIAQTKVEGVHRCSSNVACCTVPISEIAKRGFCLTASHYLSERQADAVFTELSKAKTMQSLIGKAQEMCRTKRADRSVTLNRETIEVLLQFLADAGVAVCAV
ncbi:hypothetical protein [Agathobaculum desmolans]|uniref:hypothetical protein n=1 Tax=Agathobaculum desmolans TaxID=39484 RepID=UPI00248EABC0|nr:hypothetical protein [Agathobaculum desmolans]